MDVCLTQPQTNGFLGSITRYIDCQAQALGSNAWHALSLPGSTLSVVLTGFLTIFIALIGYNLLLGRSLTVRSATITMVKIGAVFAFATNWSAYRTLVYDLVIDGPSQVVADIGVPSVIPGSDGTLTSRLDATDGALAQLAVAGVGVGIRDDVPPPPFAGFNAFALGGSRILYLTTAIAGLGAVRVAAGLMLALGPFFIAFLLFDSTRSLFEGWVRVLAGAALATVGVSVALGFELAMLEPWLAEVLERRMAGEDLPSVPSELFVLTCVFTLIVIGVLFACLRLARSFRLAPPCPTASLADAGSAQPRADGRLEHVPAASREKRSRAAAVADILVSSQRRESGSHVMAAEAARRGVLVPGNRASQPADLASPVGRSFSRRARARVTARSQKRDFL
jgi:type IV secretion system protein VirB6